MKMKLVLLSLVISTQAFAAIPPLAQSKKEIEAILTSPKLQEKIPVSDYIEQILRTSSGYLIVTNQRILPVIVHHLPSKRLGPGQFELEFQDPTEIRHSITESSREDQENSHE